jgi:septum formation protein
MDIYLASQSPRRRELLAQAGVRFQVLPLRASLGRVDVDETPLPNEGFADYVVRLARAKAEAGRRRVLERHLLEKPVLGADTTVTLDGAILGKPADFDAARVMLRSLSDRVHVVATAVAIACRGETHHALSLTEVLFAELSARDIDAYIASGEPFDKAGGYGIQGRAGAFVAQLDGSYTGVMGLPLYETCQLIRNCLAHE